MAVFASGNLESHGDVVSPPGGDAVGLLAAGNQREIIRDTLTVLSRHAGGSGTAVMLTDQSGKHLVGEQSFGFGADMAGIISAASGVRAELTRTVLSGEIWRRMARPEVPVGSFNAPVDLAIPIALPSGDGSASRVWGCVIVGTTAHPHSTGVIAHAVAAARIIALHLESELEQRRVAAASTQQFGLSAAQSPTVASEDIAAALRDGRIQPWYQPLFDLDSLNTVAAEALARWVEPDGSVVSPSEFIPAIVKTGLMPRLTSSILRQVIRDVAYWSQTRSLPDQFKVSVNISMSDITGGMLPSVVGSLLSEYGLDPAMLCLELTETEAMINVEHSLATLHELRDLGVSLSIDDFGTGYSSLSYLTQLPVDVVKIDRAFVQGLSTRRGDDAIIGAVVDVADAVGLTVLAEGIETEEELNKLRVLGVKMGQGFLVSPAIRAEALLDHLADAG